MVAINKNILGISLANMLIIIISIFIPNNFLVYNSFYLYGSQGTIFLLYLISKADKFYQVFTPSFFVLFYYIVNLSFGSFLLPRDFGFQKWYNADIYNIKYYNIIVPFFLACNFGLFLIVNNTLDKLKGKILQHNLADYNKSNLQIKILTLGVIYTIVSYLEISNFFSFQLIILIIICIDLASVRHFLRYFIYLIFLAITLKFNFENKREVVIILFAILFIESSYAGWELNFSFKKISMYFAGIILFFSLILSASIMRGYGGFEKGDFLDAFKSVPQYIGQEIFIDGLTENLELNYNYGSAITSMNLILDGKINYQFGATIFKILFIPIPREVVPFKPESMMQLYTKKYQPSFWKDGGSLPVNISCDMFLNFSYLGLFVFLLIWHKLDNLFFQIFLNKKNNIKQYSLVFLTLHVLPLARGSGIELYLIYYLYALLFLLVYFSLLSILKNNSKICQIH